jgi:hypothetical protein
MAEKGMTRAEAEACWASCQTKMAGGKACSKSCSKETCSKSCSGGGHIKTASATDGKHVHSREACIDACVAKGMSHTDAEAAADKCGNAGFHSAAAVQAVEAGASAGSK